MGFGMADHCWAAGVLQGLGPVLPVPAIGIQAQLPGLEALKAGVLPQTAATALAELLKIPGDRKSTRLNSSHVAISYAVFCLKKKKKEKGKCCSIVQIF